MPLETLRGVARDLRHGARRLASSPAFTLTSIATLALAIGVCTTLFAALDAVLLRPLALPGADRVVMIWTEIPSQGVREGRSAYATAESWRQAGSVEALGVLDPASMTLSRGDDLEPIGASRLSPELFALLGVAPLRGRPLSVEDATARRRVALVSERFARTRLGLDRAVGATLTLDAQPYEVVGVLPETSRDIGLGNDVWLPLTLTPDWDAQRLQRGAGPWFVIARLRPGTGLDAAERELTAILRADDRTSAMSAADRGVRLVTWRAHLAGPRAPLVLWLSAAAGVLVLLVAVANVAGLSLARGLGRAPEVALRVALGASRASLLRLLLAESLTMAAIAGGLGVCLAIGGTGALRTFGPPEVVALQTAAVDWRVLAWVVGVSALAGGLIGLAPAVTLWRRDLRAAGLDSGQRVAGGGATRLRRLLIVTEIAVGVVLLAGAGLLVRSWWNVTRIAPGFQPDGLVAVSVATPAAWPAARRAAFYARAVDAAGAVPGVQRAAVASEVLVGGVAEQTVLADGGDGPVSRSMALRRDEIGGAFLETVGTPLRRGRRFTADDRAGAPPVAIVNEAMAARLWPGRDAVGQRFRVGTAADAPDITVVGVAGDMRRQGPEIEPVPQMFVPIAQDPGRRALLLVRPAAADPAALVPSLRDAVRRTDAEVMVYGSTTLRASIDRLLAPRRLQTSLLTGVAMLALLLAATGLYGLLHYSVAARTAEIGVRMALGAQARDILWLVVREGLALGLAGLGLGLAGAWLLGQTAASLLFGVVPADRPTLAAVAATTALVVLAACSLPARRAASIAPVAAWRRIAMILAGAVALTIGGPAGAAAGQTAGASPARPQTVLFLCPHGAAKSVLASAHFRRLARQRGLNVTVQSAGTEPDPAVAPAVAARLRAQGDPVPDAAPRAVTAADLAAHDVVVSLGCDLAKYPTPRGRLVRWDDVPSPSADLDAADTSIRSHVAALVDELVAATGDPSADIQRLGRDVLKDLIETDTTHSSGSTTLAANRMAERLVAAGFPAGDVIVVGGKGTRGNLVARYRGRGTGPKPVLFLAHLDVVEARRDDWSMDPFVLTERDGWFYGRGTLDVKGGAATLVTAFCALRQRGYAPERDLILALTADEEGGADNGVVWLLQNRRDLIDAAYAINVDSGGPEIRGGTIAALDVQAAEKVFQSFTLTVRNPGGHSSLPVKENAITRLSSALVRLSSLELPVRTSEITRGWFGAMAGITGGRHAADMRAVATPSPDPAAARRLSEASPFFNAMLRTTCVPTLLEGGHAANALPQQARATVNCRMLPDEQVAAVQAAIAGAVADPQVEIVPVGQPTPSPPSPLVPDVLAAIETAAAATWTRAVPIVPQMETGATDGLFLRNAGVPVYGVTGIGYDPDDVRAHGKDERILVRSYYEGITFVEALARAIGGGQK
jgi:predicted permease